MIFILIGFDCWLLAYSGDYRSVLMIFKIHNTIPPGLTPKHDMSLSKVYILRFFAAKTGQCIFQHITTPPPSQSHKSN